MAAGVYAITCTVNGHQYVGQTEDFEQRWALHRSQLLHGIHHSRYLQRAYDRHGADAFAYTVLEVVTQPSQEALNECESRWFALLKPAYVARPAGSQRGYKHRPESRAKMSAAKRGIIPTIATAAAAEMNRGKARSQSIRNKISATKTGVPRPDMIGKMADPEYAARVKAGRDAYWARRKARQEGQVP